MDGERDGRRIFGVRRILLHAVNGGVQTRKIVNAVVVVIVVFAVARSTPICASFSFALGDGQDCRHLRATRERMGAGACGSAYLLSIAAPKNENVQKANAW
jgi:hypothetical protein